MAAFILCLAALPCLAQSEAQMRSQINKAAAQLSSMQCEFVQTKHLKMLNKSMVSNGKMYYQKSNKLRWEYTTPYKYTFILNGSKALLKNNNRTDVVDTNKNRMMKEIGRVMMNTLMGNCLQNDKDFKTSITSTQTEYVATLLPQRKDIKSMFQKIILHFNRKNSMVTSVELVEKNGDRTVIELKNVKTNVPISQNMFAVG